MVAPTLAAQDLNVLPFLAMTFNGIGWLGYACATEDLYLLTANAICVILGIFYLFSTYHLATRKVRAWESMLPRYVLAAIEVNNLVLLFEIAYVGSC